MRVQSFPAATPSLRPLARCLLLALMMPIGAAWAYDLDGGSAEVVVGDPVEQWRVRNGGALTINGGEANQISASEDSRVTLNNAVITRDPSVSGEYYNVSLQDDASLEAVGTLFQGGGITLSNGSATARLVNSSINIPGGEAGRQLSVGLDLFHNPTVPATPIDPRGVLDRTHVRVGDAPDASRDSSSGIGVRMGFGTVDIVNGSFIDADNVGVLFLGSVGPFDNTLRVDASTINSRRGAALRVAPRRRISAMTLRSPMIRTSPVAMAICCWCKPMKRLPLLPRLRSTSRWMIRAWQATSPMTEPRCPTARWT